MATRAKAAPEEPIKYRRRFSLSEDYKMEVSVYKNKDKIPILNLRRFYLHKETNEWRPDRQGLTIREDNVPQLLSVIGKIMAVADSAPPPDFAPRATAAPAKTTRTAKSTKTTKKKKGAADDY